MDKISSKTRVKLFCSKLLCSYAGGFICDVCHYSFLLSLSLGASGGRVVLCVSGISYISNTGVKIDPFYGHALQGSVEKEIEPGYRLSCNIAFTASEDLDQPAHSRSLIRVLVVCMRNFARLTLRTNQIMLTI